MSKKKLIRKNNKAKNKKRLILYFLTLILQKIKNNQLIRCNKTKIF